MDDKFVHGLAVYRDLSTNRLRLHATVWEGGLMGCPVWTAFRQYIPYRILQGHC